MRLVKQAETSLACIGKKLLAPAKKEITRLKLRRRGSFGGSTWFSLAVRPVLEKDWIKALLMAPMFVAALGVGIDQLPDTTGTEAWESEQPIKTVMSYEMKMPQDGDRITYLIPVEQLNGVSQGYQTGHFGIDLMASFDSPVIAMERGTVTSVERDTFGYGKHVYIKHLYYDVTSLYAHLNRISVQVGQELSSGQTIGTVGLTGWSTGPHLHFEVYDGEDRVNPMKYLGEALKIAKEQAKN